MKLISLYIENFGGLSRYSLEFGEGLTVIQEPNGFGKTTLAEFIRAMFYGFPRKAKTLDKSKRQKYTPWQGGVFGGNLVFSHEGKRYRMERTFGATPKGDSFTLIDLDTGKKSDRFSEEIGLELFQLDSDSFERSTYLPQLHDSGPLTTNSIQAKLGDLVEDPGDVGNYDKAVAALKTARSGFIPYRGSGGSVAEARANISRLQNELEQIRQQEAVLTTLRASVAELEGKLESLAQQKGQIRKRLDLAIEADSVASVHREYRKLEEREQQLRSVIDELESRYPKGVPSAEAMEEIRQIAADRAILTAQTVTTPEDTAAQTFIKENEARFGGHVPTSDELDSCRRAISRFQTLQAEAEATGLSGAEKLQYEKLLPLYESGALEENRLSGLDGINRALVQKRHELEGLRFPDAEAEKLENLNRYFAPGVPEDEELSAARQALAEADSLRRERPRSSLSALQILLWILTAAGLAAGVWLLVSRVTLWGCAALGTGAAALVAAVVMAGHIRSTGEQEVLALERQAAGFAQRYTGTTPLSDALYEIRDNLDDYRKLQGAHLDFESRRKALSDEIRTLAGQLEAELPGTSDDFDKAILSLHLARNQFLDLQAELAQTAQTRSALQLQIEEERTRIAGFLSGYFPDVQPDLFHALLSALQRDSEQYLRCRERVTLWQQRKHQHDERFSRCETQLTSFFTDFGLTRSPDIREQLLRIRDDSRIHWDSLRSLDRLQEEKDAFARENRKALETQLSDTRDQVPELRMQEQDLTRETDAVSSRLLTVRQQQHRTEEQLLQIPQLQDELEQWQEVSATHRKKADILDSTLDFLEKARENLQNSYLGPVRTRFQHYMQRLPGEQPGQILLSPDLDVQLERCGKARELGYFSAGQTDMVMLCMRLALVDALFTKAKPFVILDDPFVNLDDAHTAEALRLLQELAEDTQILYLVCNSSRAI